MDISGEYKILKGHCPLSSSPDEYTGKIEIKNHGENYMVVWNLDGKIYQGTAILSGKNLAIAYDLENHDFGVGSYQFDDKFISATGKYSVKNGNKQGYELWKKIH